MAERPRNVRCGGSGEATAVPDATLPQLVESDDSRRVWRLVTTIECVADKHDTITAYKNHGCRCPAAGRRAVAYEKRRQAGFIAPNEPADLTMRRLQALAFLGWSSDAVADLIGRNPVTVSEIRRGECAHVTGRTAAAVRKVYRRLYTEPGPSRRTKAYAARQGWGGPSVLLLYGVADEVRVARALRGEATDLTRAERLTAVHVLHAAGRSYRAMADQLHVTDRQVHRDLTDLGLIVDSTGAVA